MPENKLMAVHVRCPECDATHVRPQRIDPDNPPETVNKTCIAPHPSRNAGFEGCGETHDLVVEKVEEPSHA